MLSTILGELLNYYRLGCFQFMDPKVVITFIDNSSSFHWLAENFRSAQFFAIQNGQRTNDQLERTYQYHQHFFSFGNYEKDRYALLCYVVESCYPVGSLLGGYYKYNNNKRNTKNKYDISIVSQTSESLHEKSAQVDIAKSTNLMNTFLAKYISEYKVKVVVLLRTGSGNNSEIEYFKYFFNDNVDYQFNNKNEMTTYRGMDESEIVVSFFSAASVEAFGWGKKILHCDFTGSNKYNDYDPMIMLTEPNYDSFKKRLNELRCEPYDEYRKRTKDYASYLMNNDPDCPPHIYIRNKIVDYL